MARGAKLLFVALVYAAPTGDQIALTLAQATEEMLRGVHAFVAESQASPPPAAKAVAMARQLAGNLHAMSQVARKLDRVLHGQAKGALEQQVEGLEGQVAGLQATNRDLEAEKQSLIGSVREMLGGSSKQTLQRQLREAEGEVEKLQKAIDDAKQAAEADERTREEANAALTQQLNECQEPALLQASIPEETIARSALDCEKKLDAATSAAQGAERRTGQMMETVKALMRTHDDLEPQEPSSAVQSRERAVQEANVAAHMSETAKIDTYIARSGDMAAEVASTALEWPSAAEPAGKPSAEALAVAGEGVARYLRGDSLGPRSA